MNKWRKRNTLPGVSPMETEAVMLTHDNALEVAAWCHGDLVEERDAITNEVTHLGINLESMGGPIRALEGVVIQKSAEGIYILHEVSNFIRRFEQVEETESAETSTDDPFEQIGRV